MKSTLLVSSIENSSIELIEKNLKQRILIH